MGHGLAAITALLGWSALVLQFYLLVYPTSPDMPGGWTGASRFFGYFTVLTNILVALVLSAPLLKGRIGRWLSSASVRAATTVYVAIVGIVYALVLKQLWNPQGLQKLADLALHEIVPILYVLHWIFFGRTRSLRPGEVLGWLTYPGTYLVYALLRGALEGWYAYPFLDPSVLGYGRVFLNAAGLLVGFSALGLLVVGLDRLAKPLPRSS